VRGIIPRNCEQIVTHRPNNQELVLATNYTTGSQPSASVYFWNIVPLYTKNI